MPGPLLDPESDSLNGHRVFGLVLHVIGVKRVECPVPATVTNTGIVDGTVKRTDTSGAR